MDDHQTKPRFENLLVWQKAQKLALAIYDKSSHGSFAVDYPLKNQIRRAAISVFSNIAEGQGRFSRKEYRHYLSISNGSVYELISQIHFARELGYLSPQDSANLVNLCSEISKMIKGLRNSKVV